MYDGWKDLIGPVLFSGIITLAAWTVPRILKQGSGWVGRHRGRANDFSQ